MTVQMQTVSARLPSEDLQWLSALELPGAVTPSDKLRALIAQIRKQHEGALDYSACLAWLRDLLSSFVIELRGIEQASPRTQVAFHRVREHVSFVDRDRYLDADIAATVALIQSGAMSEFVA